MVEFVFPGVFVEEVSLRAQPIEGVSTSTAGFIGEAERGAVLTPIKISSAVEFERNFGPSAVSTLGIAVRQFFENGGRNAVIVRVEGHEGLATTQAALSALDRASFNLLCIPPHTSSQDLDPAELEAAASYCLKRRALFVADAPAAWTARDAAKRAAALHLSARQNVALYFPRVLAKFGSKSTPCAPCGIVAGIMSRTDSARGVWKAPAGIEASIKGATGLSLSVTDAANGPLNEVGVNALRQFPGKRLVVWGARTLAHDAEWKYVPVRRLALFLQESILRGIHWAVLEPNEETTWRRVLQQIETFLTTLWRQGAFQAQKPEQAFYVRCGLAATMTQNDIDNGHMIVEVGFAPLKPAEFVVFRIGQIMRRDPP